MHLPDHIDVPVDLPEFGDDGPGDGFGTVLAGGIGHQERHAQLFGQRPQGLGIDVHAEHAAAQADDRA